MFVISHRADLSVDALGPYGTSCRPTKFKDHAVHLIPSSVLLISHHKRFITFTWQKKEDIFNNVWLMWLLWMTFLNNYVEYVLVILFSTLTQTSHPPYTFSHPALKLNAVFSQQDRKYSKLVLYIYIYIYIYIWGCGVEKFTLTIYAWNIVKNKKSILTVISNTKFINWA